MVVVDTGGIGTKAISKNYPVEEGLTAGTTKQVGKPSLTPVKSYVSERQKVGF